MNRREKEDKKGEEGKKRNWKRRRNEDTVEEI